MAYEITGTKVSFKATAALEENRFVILDTTEGQVKYPTAATGNVIGTTMYQADANQSVGIILDGIVKITAAEAITVGAKVGTDTAGKAVAAAIGEKTFGLALEAAAADGEVISVLLYKEGVTLA